MFAFIWETQTSEDTTGHVTRKPSQVRRLYSSRFLRRARPKSMWFLFAWKNSAFWDILGSIVNFFGSINYHRRYDSLKTGGKQASPPGRRSAVLM
jgi:hypothetical protein